MSQAWVQLPNGRWVVAPLPDTWANSPQATFDPSQYYPTAYGYPTIGSGFNPYAWFGGNLGVPAGGNQEYPGLTIRPYMDLGRNINQIGMSGLGRVKHRRRRGVGDTMTLAGCAMGPLTQDQQAQCDALQTSNIANFFYNAGQADSSGSSLPTWIVPAAIGLFGFVLLSKAMR